MEKGRTIGIFDSGVGGLTVLSACRKALPRARFLYFGDNARAPYGGRPEEEISRFAREGVERLRAEGAEIVVLACNTATAVCADALRREVSFPVLGIEPAVRPAAKTCRRCLVLCTPATARSERLRALIERNGPSRFFVRPLPDLAGAIEAALVRGEPLALERRLPRGEFDGVVLGCTHYSFFAREIAAFYRAPVFDGAEGTARRLASLAVEPEWSEREKINRRLLQKWSEDRKINRRLSSKEGDEEDFEPVFVGESAEINRKVYKQTFK